MDRVSVNQISITPLKRIQVIGGDVLHGMKCCDPGYTGFGEAYFSFVDYRAVKAWKKHLRMTLNFVVPLGNVLFVFLDAQGTVREEMVGENRLVRLTVPPGLWFGFQGLSSPHSLIMNVADICHDPLEVEHKKISAFTYMWY